MGQVQPASVGCEIVIPVILPVVSSPPVCESRPRCTVVTVASQFAEPPTIATRCAVFAKSDLIHRQQEGCSRAEMWSGLCRGMTRTVLQERDRLVEFITSRIEAKSSGTPSSSERMLNRR